MPEQDDPFSPHRVDESVEQLFSTGQPYGASPLQECVDPSARLMDDMQKLYSFERKRYLRALQRVEDRLVEQYVIGDKRAVADPVAPGQQQHSPRKMQRGKLYHMEQKQPSKFGRRISLLAAVLIMALLIGSLVVVLNAIHSSTITASGPSGTPTATPTAQATPLPVGGQGNVVYTYPASMDDFYAFAWSPDSKLVASSTNGQVQIRDAMNGKLKVTFTPSGPGASVLALSWSPNGRYLAVGSTHVQIIDPTTGAVVHTFPGSLTTSTAPAGSYLSAANPFSGGNMAYGTAWSPDGTLMATSLNGVAYGNVVDVWNVNTGQIVYTFRGQSSREVESVAWSSDGKYIASAGYDGTVQVWNAHTGQVIFKHQISGIPYAAWAPTGMALAFISDANTIQVWNVATNSLLTSHSGTTNEDLAWSPDGQQIASPSGNSVVIWNAATGKTTYTFTRQGSQVRSLAWSPNGKYIVSGCSSELNSNRAYIWTA